MDVFISGTTHSVHKIICRYFKIYIIKKVLIILKYKIIYKTFNIRINFKKCTTYIYFLRYMYLLN